MRQRERQRGGEGGRRGLCGPPLAVPLHCAPVLQVEWSGGGYTYSFISLAATRSSSVLLDCLPFWLAGATLTFVRILACASYRAGHLECRDVLLYLALIVC